MTEQRAIPVEAAVVWLLLAVVAVEIFVTYSRLPARELYNVSGSGLAGGASRSLVFLNFPTALIGLAILALLFDRLAGRPSRVLAAIAAVLCAAVFWPGVVSQANLDVRPVNALAAIGVLITFVLTVTVARRAGFAALSHRRGDRMRLALAAALLVLAAPWLAAEVGFFLDGVPVLGRLFLTGHYLHASAGLPPFPPAVHHGHHHGMDGFLLVLAALLLSRPLGGVRPTGLRRSLAAYLALMLTYGIGNIANDFWTEQVFKRHWTTWQLPNVLEPRLTIAWGILILAAAAVVAIGAKASKSPRRPQARSHR